jgi:hypothetical protein
MVTEAYAALCAVKFYHIRRFFKIIVEGVSLQVVKALNHKGVVWTMYGQIVEDIKMVIRNCEYWEIRHTKRDGNGVAHLLAKIGACLDSDRV